jgi:tRNA U34 5-methylaminomethyl-2-thiouridine-forming methyltransferase MnmC
MTNFVNKITEDGSVTFFSLEFQETFHSQFGAKQEAIKKFAQPCQLDQKAQEQNQIKILDICYGLGYNSAAALDMIWSVNPNCLVELIALEIDPNVPQQAVNYLDQWSKPISELLTKLAFNYNIETETLQAKLLIEDCRKTIQNLQQFQADVIFLDPFSPPKCPQLWTVEFLSLVAKCLKPTGKLVTYSCAASVRTALQLSGLSIGSTPSVGRRSPGTLASYQPEGLLPLSQQELEHLQTKAAIPYRDPTLEDTASVILERRQQEQQQSLLESTSQWKKRFSQPQT